tara:strand:+ start:1703 stop:1957 length:255 start_codon:yes stop_codon:yes gene_type:complete
MKSKSPFKQDKCAEAWAKFKEGYTKRKSKTSMRRNSEGKMEKYEKPISNEANLKEYNREKNEFECVNGKISLKKTDDAERPIKD